MFFQNINGREYSEVSHSENWLKCFWAESKIQWRENAALIILCVVAFIAMQLSLQLLDVVNQRSFVAYIRRALLSITPMVLFLYIVCRLFQLCFYEKPDVITTTLIRDVVDVITDWRRYARVIPMLLITSFGFIAFINFKVIISDIVPFYLDTTLVDLDRKIHFGKLPHEWLSSIVNYPSLVGYLDFSYKLWYFVMFYLWGWAAWGASDNGWRRQFVLAFMLCWIMGGTVLALLLSSVGPCFYDVFVAGTNPYAGHMARLGVIHEMKPLLAFETQRLMAIVFLDDNQAIKIGISAMPSLHNTLAVLFAIVGFKVHRNLGYILTAYAVLIFIGSVVLGWHYAVDGYAGLILAFAMWKFAALLLKWQDKWFARGKSL